MKITKNIALFGGSFDPPTLAHETIMSHCLHDSRFDEVWIMPSAVRTDKPAMHDELIRLSLLQTLKCAIFDDDRRLVISDFELRLPRPTETYDTYQALRREYPDTRFWFVYGADSIATMSSWSHGNYLRHELSMVVVPRVGYAMPPRSDRLRHVPQQPVFAKGVSSSLVRARVAQGLNYTDLVSQAVAVQIARDKLYLEDVQ